MKKFMELVLQIKSMAGLFFMGSVVLYMAAGWLLGETSMPFAFVVQAILLAVAIALLWQLIFSEALFKRLRYSLRLSVFMLALVLVLSLFLAVFFRFPSAWGQLWLLVAGLMVVGAAGVSLVCELYFKVSAQKMNEMLAIYKSAK